MSENGVRCPSCMDLEYDHIITRARGGRSDDAGNLRLRCRAHNQYEAERTFGKQFMEAKREQARAAAAKRKVEKEAERERAQAAAAKRKAEKAAEREQARVAAAKRKAERYAAPMSAEASPEEEGENVRWFRESGYPEEEVRTVIQELGPRRGIFPSSRRWRLLHELEKRAKQRPTVSGSCGEEATASPAVA